MTHNPAEELREALKIADRALWIHAFVPRGHDTANDRDTCQQCGRNFRHEHHLRLTEGAPSDVIAEASRIARTALTSPAPAGGKRHRFASSQLLPAATCAICKRHSDAHGPDGWSLEPVQELHELPPPSPDVAGVVESIIRDACELIAEEPAEEKRIVISTDDLTVILSRHLESLSAEKGRLETDCAKLWEVLEDVDARIDLPPQLQHQVDAALFSRTALTPKEKA